MDNIKIVGRHIKVTDAIAEYAIKRIGNFDKFVHKIISSQVILDVEKYRHTVEIILHTAGGKVITVKETDEDLYEAIDLAASRLKDVLIRVKDRIISTRKHRKKISTMLVDREVEPEYEHARLSVPEMTVEAAVEQFRKGKKQYIVFVNTETDHMSMVHLENGIIKVNELRVQ